MLADLHGSNRRNTVEGRNDLDTTIIVRIAAGILTAGVVFVLNQRRREQAQPAIDLGKRIPR
jgi:hypothetical protein